LIGSRLMIFYCYVHMILNIDYCGNIKLYKENQPHIILANLLQNKRLYQVHKS